MFEKYRKFVYMTPPPDGLDKASGEVAESEKEIKKRKEEIESDIKALKATPEEAAKSAFEEITNIVNNSYSRFEKTGVEQDELEQYRQRLEKAKEDAKKEIESNKETYKKIEAFVKKRAEMELMVEQNSRGLEASKDMTGTEWLADVRNIVKALNERVDEVKAMDAPGMDMEKDALVNRIDELVKKFEARGEELRALHMNEVNSMDEKIDEVMADLQASKRPSLQSLQALSDHAVYLAKAGIDLQGIPEEKELFDMVNKKLDQVDELHYEGMRMFEEEAEKKYPEYEEAKKELNILQQNKERAYQNWLRVQNKPNAGIQEKTSASNWVAGANSKYDEKLAELNSIYEKIDRSGGKLPPEATAEKPPEEEIPSKAT